MNSKLLILLEFIFIISCSKTNLKDNKMQINGTWKLQEATLIEKGDTTITDFTKNISFIKIINDSHFAFLSHSIPFKKDSSSTYSSGGGTYTLTENIYTEHLEYCSDRAWENHDFKFTLTQKGDTLVQSGVEKIEKEGIDRLNIEKYIKLK